MPRSRLGVALLIPQPVSIEIDALRRAVGGAVAVRVDPHVTLVPPVNVREGEIGDALEVLRDAAVASRPLRLELGPVTSFAPVSPTLHLAVGGDLEHLRALRDAVFTEPLSRRLTHAFVPHVTLSEQCDRIAESVLALRDFRCEVVIDRVHLLEERRSDEDHSRSWCPVADALLGGRPAVVGRGGLELELTTSERLAPDAGEWIRAQWDDFDVARHGGLLPRDVPIAVVARRDRRIVAAADGELRPATGEAYLAHLMVAADLRDEGIGAHVLAAFTAAAANRGATHLTLRTEADGRSRSFYERLGFTEWYPLPAWRNGRDFVQMRRNL